MKTTKSNFRLVFVFLFGISLLYSCAKTPSETYIVKNDLSQDSIFMHYLGADGNEDSTWIAPFGSFVILYEEGEEFLDHNIDDNGERILAFAITEITKDTLYPILDFSLIANWERRTAGYKSSNVEFTLVIDEGDF